MSHYFLGADPSRRITDVPHFAEVVHRQPWPGIDLRWRGLQGRALEYDLLLAPGADPGSVAFDFEGASAAEIDDRGDLVLRTEGGILRHRRPLAWQEAAGSRRAVAVSFERREDGRIGFRVGARDRGLPLLIDPEVTYGTFLGGNAGDSVDGVAIAPDGKVCVAGRALSTDFPVKSAYQATKGGAVNWGDAFVTKLSSDGASLAWSTYLGGTLTDYALGVAVDSSGAVFVVGRTNSTDFPQVQAFRGPQGGDDGFLAKIDASGTSLHYSTYIGTNDGDEARAVAVDGSGSAVVAGYTGSMSFPLVKQVQSFKGDWDVFVCRFAWDGSSLAFSTLFGGNREDWANGVAVDADGSIVVAGHTKSTGFTVLNAADSTLGGTQDGFVFRISGAATPALVFSTFLGGGAVDSADEVALDADGNAWVTGTTRSTDMLLSNPVDNTLGGNSDAFLAGFKPTGTVLASTYLGGSADESGWGVDTAPDGTVCVVGTTTSNDFPLLHSIQGARAGLSDAFVTVFQGAGREINSSTYLGGAADDIAYGVAVDSASLLHAAGSTESTSFPTKSGFQGTKGTAADGFVVSLGWVPVPPPSCKAQLGSLTSALIEWKDGSLNETGFVVQRAVEAGPFEDIAAVGPGVVSYEDPGLAPSTTYTYRVRAVNALGASAHTDPSSVTTPPPPVEAPRSPESPVATVASPRRVDLEWVDASDNEDFFIVARRDGAGLFDTKATPRLGSTSWSDTTPLPGRTYSYSVRAVNPIGSSAPSPLRTVTMPSTLVPSVTKGRLKDGDGFGKDSFTASGTLLFGEEALATALDPVEQDLSLRLGGWDSPPLLSIRAADSGWKERKGKFTWKSPRGSPTKAVVKVDPAAGTWSVKFTRITFAAAPANPLRLTFGVSTDGGHVEQDWTPGKRPGDFRFP